MFKVIVAPPNAVLFSKVGELWSLFEDVYFLLLLLELVGTLSLDIDYLLEK
jgi:hypothetical protein